MGRPANTALGTEVKSVDHSGRLKSWLEDLGAGRWRNETPHHHIADGAYCGGDDSVLSGTSGEDRGRRRPAPGQCRKRSCWAVEGAEMFPEEGHLFGAHRSDGHPAAMICVRFGQPCIEAFFGGSLGNVTSRRLENSPTSRLMNSSGLLGSDFRKKRFFGADNVRAGRSDRYAGGSYS